MAKLSEHNQRQLIADIESGRGTVRDLAKKYRVGVATVMRHKSKAEQTEQTEQTINAGIAYKTGLAKIGDEIKRNTIINVVDERTAHLPMIFKAGAYAVKMGAEILQADKTMNNVEALSRTVKNVASVIEPKQSGNVSVTQQTAVINPPTRIEIVCE